MNRQLLSLLEKANAINPRIFLWTNLGLAGLIALSHGGALLLVRAKPTLDAGPIESIAIISLPLAGLIALSAAIALAVNRLQT